MDDFNVLVEDFIGELLDNAVRNLKMCNAEYKKLDDENNSIVMKIEKMMEKMNGNEKKLMDSFFDGLLEMEVLKEGYFYRRGFRDCLKFMRLMGK